MGYLYEKGHLSLTEVKKVDFENQEIQKKTKVIDLFMNNRYKRFIIGFIGAAIIVIPENRTNNAPIRAAPAFLLKRSI